jgi:hypothetical protein
MPPCHAGGLSRRTSFPPTFDEPTPSAVSGATRFRGNDDTTRLLPRPPLSYRYGQYDRLVGAKAIPTENVSMPDGHPYLVSVCTSVRTI